MVSEGMRVWFESSPTVFTTTCGPCTQEPFCSVSFVQLWIRLAKFEVHSFKSVLVLHWCHLSGSSVCKSEIKKTWIEITSFICKIDNHKIAIPNSWKYFWFQTSWKWWNIHSKKITKPTILALALRQSQENSLPELMRRTSAWFSLYGGYLTLVNSFDVNSFATKFSCFASPPTHHNFLFIVKHSPPPSPSPNLCHCWLKISKLWKLKSLCKKRFFYRICTYMVCRCNSRLERTAWEEPPNMNPGLRTKKDILHVVEAS